jgi:diketogulonate reductase-like aldo/keto reductase
MHFAAYRPCTVLCCPAAQFEVHPKRPETVLRAACAAAGVAVVAYASLGCGQLLAEPVVQQVAARTGRTQAQVYGEHMRVGSLEWQNLH